MLTTAWTNPLNPLDGNADSVVTPVGDILPLINELNRPQYLDDASRLVLPPPNPIPFYFDVNCDGQLTPVGDVLPLINAINGGLEPPGLVATLREGSQFLTEATESVELGQASGTRTIYFDIDAEFDVSDGGALQEDTLLISLVNPSNIDQTLLDRGQAGTALFSMSADRVEYEPGTVHFDGRTVSIDVSELSDLNEGLLKFQLLNTDQDQGTNVAISNLSSEVDLTGSPSPVFPPPSDLRSAGDTLEFERLSIAHDIQPGLSNVRVRSDGRLTGELSVTNRGIDTGRDLAVVFRDLPEGVSLRSPSGVDPSGDPYVNLREAVRSGGLEAGGTTSRVEVELRNFGLTQFPLVAEVYSGGPNVAPSLDPIGPLSVTIGQRVETTLSASDPDGDDVVLSLRTAAMPPTGMLHADGRLHFAPAPGEEGRYELTVVASDGAAEVTQNLVVDVLGDASGDTRLSGFVLNTLSEPLANVPVDVGAISGTTDAQGFFSLSFGQDPLPSDTLKIHGQRLATADVYPFIAEKIDLVLEREVYTGVDNRIERPIYLPALDVDSAVTIDPTSDTRVTTPAIPGAEVFVRAGTLLDESGAPYGGEVHITEVPPELTPAALPANLSPDLVVTIQPGDMNFTEPAPLTLPNRAGWESGTEMTLWSINPQTGLFDPVGTGFTSFDGMIRTSEGGIRTSSWHFWVPTIFDFDPTHW